MMQVNVDASSVLAAAIDDMMRTKKNEVRRGGNKEPHTAKPPLPLKTMAPRAIATPAALLLRLLLVVVYILPFVQSYSTLYQPTPPPGLPPSLSRRANYDGRKTQLLKHTPLKPLSAYSVSAGAAKDSNIPSLWRSSFWKLPTPLEKLASEFGFFHEGKM